MNPIEIQTTLTLEDWRAYLVAAQQDLPRPRSLQLALLGLATGVTTAVAVSIIGLRGAVSWPSVALGAGLLYGVSWFLQRRVRRQMLPDVDGCVLGLRTLRFDADGVHAVKPLLRTTYEWRSVQRISATSEHLFLWVDRIAAIQVPLRDLPAGLTAAELHALLQQQCEAARTTLPPAVDSGSGVSATDTTRAPDQPYSEPAPASLRELLRALGCLVLVRQPPRAGLNLSDRALAAIVLIYLAAWLALDWARNSTTDGTFDWYGVLPLAWQSLVIVLLAAVGARAAEPPLPFRQTFAITLLLTPLYVVSAWFATQWPDLIWPIGLFGALYFAACMHRGWQSLTGRLQLRPYLLNLAVMLAVVGIGTQTYATPQFWFPPEEEEAEASDTAAALDAEALLYRQSSMIAAEAARLQRPPQMTAAGFFVGFAGVGEQHVFASEIALARRMMAQHFDTGLRSIQLVNDQGDLDAHPLASLSGLERALAAIAGRMDLQRDVLFLALSSHGSAEGALVVSNATLPLHDVSVQDLVQVLRDSGIRRKVIIVSACYAGSFIAPLANPDTIIITAAAADRTSFGCAEDRELTYFGEAFYRDALQQTGDLRRAFELAKVQIARREAQEGEVASNPQAYFGAQLEQYLRAWSAPPPQ